MPRAPLPDGYVRRTGRACDCGDLQRWRKRGIWTVRWRLECVCGRCGPWRSMTDDDRDRDRGPPPSGGGNGLILPTGGSSEMDDPSPRPPRGGSAAAR